MTHLDWAQEGEACRKYDSWANTFKSRFKHVIMRGSSRKSMNYFPDEVPPSTSTTIRPLSTSAPAPKQARYPGPSATLQPANSRTSSFPAGLDVVHTSVRTKIPLPGNSSSAIAPSARPPAATAVVVTPAGSGARRMAASQSPDRTSAARVRGCDARSCSSMAGHGQAEREASERGKRYRKSGAVGGRLAARTARLTSTTVQTAAWPKGPAWG